MKSIMLKGTIILTFAGILTRIIGFFYKIYLSNIIGAENLGIYQLVFPVYSLCFTIYASGLQTAVSQIIAGNSAQKNKILKISISLSIFVAFILSILLYFNSDLVATKFLLQSQCSNSLKLLAIVFPFCSITSMINGYYYGLKKTFVPAFTQLVEQIFRVICVYIIFLNVNSTSCEIAVIGLVLGEISSTVFNVLSLLFQKKSPSKNEKFSLFSSNKLYKQLLQLSVPLTMNRLLISVLHSMESALIPNMLKRSNISNSTSLSIFGILNGMAMPFILFPSAITNAFALLLLPTVSEASSNGNTKTIQKSSSVSIKYSLIIGILSTGLFIIFGNSLGIIFFNNKMAGNFIVIMSWLCPFIYLTTTLGSIINGLGKTHLTFISSLIGMAIRILFVFYYIPIKGINGYLIGLLVSQLSNCAIDTLIVFKNIHLEFDAINWILKPSLVMGFCGYFSLKAYEYFQKTNPNSLILLLTFICITSFIYIVCLFILKGIKKEDFR